MNKLLTRDEFRNSVFERDDFKCVICSEDGQDVHHILERRLFEDGGYYINNGATLCGPHHIDAEKTILTCEEIRKACNIESIVLPEHLYPDQVYDKWGNIIQQNGSRLKGELFFDESVQKILKDVLGCFTNYVKYPRTYHLSFSHVLKDDKSLKDFSNFIDKEICITVKMDGENTTGYSDGYVHARSIDSKHHPSRSWVKNYLPKVLYDLPEGWRICGENLYAKHSIKYNNLKSYFYVFSIWNEKNVCLSLKDTLDWCELLGLNYVPILYQGSFDEKIVKEIYSENFKDDECEGFVCRNVCEFSYGDFRKNVGKFVSKKFSDRLKTTRHHWIKKEIEVNKLIKNI